MKALLFLLVVLGGVWLWRSRNASEKAVTPPEAPAPDKALEMVRCTQCGIHVPGDEVITGKRGSYCSVNHLHQSEP